MRAPQRTLRRAKELRREMTLPEIMLWQALRRGRLAGLRFRRQHPIGPYILDFYCPALRLALEVDGFAHDALDRARTDERRQAWLAERGVSIIRVRATDILSADKLQAVLVALAGAAANAPSGSLRSPPPP